MNLFKNKKFRQGSFSTILTIFGIVIIILLTSVLGTMAARMNWAIDMTPNEMFTITDGTKEYLTNLNTDVTIHVLNSEDGFTGSSPTQYFTQANEMIQNYKNLSPHITVKYVDILKDPSFVSKYTDEELNPNSILLTSGTRTHWFDSRDLFNTQQTEYGISVTSSRAEQTLTSAILNVTSEVRPVVTFLGGHDELPLEGFESVLGLNNYEVTQTNIVTGELDPNATIAIINAPARDFEEAELRKLDKFLENEGKYGKTVLYMASYNQAEHSNFPNLNAFLAEWGLAVGESLIYETNQSFLISPETLFVFFANYIDTELQPKMKGTDFYNAVMFSRPIETVFEQKNSRTVTPLLASSPQSGVFPLDASGQTWQPSEKDLDGPHVVLALSSSLTYDQTTPLSSHVIALGSADALADSSLAGVNLANSDYFISLFDQLSQREDTVRIDSKAIANHEMNLTYGQAITISRIAYFIIPGVLVIVGLIIWLRRRHK